MQTTAEVPSIFIALSDLDKIGKHRADWGLFELLAECHNIAKVRGLDVGVLQRYAAARFNAAKAARARILFELIGQCLAEREAHGHAASAMSFIIRKVAELSGQAEEHVEVELRRMAENEHLQITVETTRADQDGKEMVRSMRWSAKARDELREAGREA